MLHYYWVCLALIGSVLSEDNSCSVPGESCSSAPVVTTSLGKVRGAIHLSRGGRQYFSYTGIPYAKPPLAALRFAPSVPAEPWNGTFDGSKSVAPICFQGNNMSVLLGYPPKSGQEDCLFVNVHTPRIGGSLPVLLYIHGGAFEVGAAGDASTKKYFMDEDVVVVAVQYRLGALGFLTTEDGVIPGNLGLKDQALALEWVKREIKNFGGNPDLITAIGISAGGAAVHYLCSSPRTRGLLKGCISESGVGGAVWSLKRPEVNKAFLTQFENQLGCSHEKILRCLQKMPVEELVLENHGLFGLDDYFGPVLECPKAKEAFLTEWPPKQSDFPWLTGIAADEGLLISMLFTVMDKVKLDKFVQNSRIHMIEKLKVDEKTADVIYKQFFVNKNPLDSVAEYFGESLFAYPAIKELSHHQGPKYFYLFNRTGATFPGFSVKGVNHAAEVIYLFEELPFMPKGWPTTEDVEVSRNLVKMWVNFAKTQTPNFKDSPLKWKLFGNSAETLFITNDGISMQKFQKYNDFVSLWKGVI